MATEGIYNVKSGKHSPLCATGIFIMKLKIAENIAKHSFTKIGMEDTIPELKKIYPEIEKRSKDWDWLSKVESKLEDPEWYRYEVFKKQSALTSVLDRIVCAHAFIQKFPSQKTYEKKFSITQYNWLEYHFFSYMLNVVSLFDCLLILTNTVFRIGLKDSDCKRSTIINNYWITQSKFDTLLKDFEKISNRYKEIRDLHLHRGKGKNIAEVIKSDTLSFLKTVSLLQLYDKETFPKKIIEKGYKIETLELLKHIENECKEIQVQIFKIYTFLVSIYLKKRPPRTEE